MPTFSSAFHCLVHHVRWIDMFVYKSLQDPYLCNKHEFLQGYSCYFDANLGGVGRNHSGYGLSQWTKADLLSFEPLGTNFSEILIEILAFSFKKMCLEMSAKVAAILFWGRWVKASHTGSWEVNGQITTCLPWFKLHAIWHFSIMQAGYL